MTTISSWEKISFVMAVAISLLFTLTAICLAENSDVQQYLNRLASNKFEVKILAAKEITTSGITDPVLFDKIEKLLLFDYNRKASQNEEIDLMSWYCKDLASSGLQKYKKTVDFIANNSYNIKLGHHAKQSLGLFPIYANNNREMNKLVDIASSKLDKKNTKFMSMLRSRENKLKSDAAKMIVKTINTDKVVFNEVESQLLRNYETNRAPIDLMAWYCKALASSGLSQYKQSVETVFNNTKSRKLKKYAKQSLESFSTYAKQHAEISKYKNGNLDESSAIIMTYLRSDYVSLKMKAAKMIIASEDIKPDIFKVVGQELIFGLTQNPTGEEVGQEDEFAAQRKWKSSPNKNQWISYDTYYSETMSLLCTALTTSHDKNYKQILKEVIHTTEDEKVAGYARKAYDKL